ncbi:MAG: carboxypeptidase-like regulatory domain-containing protein [Armatimonadetes bacterium]|nr:carboxypeptidase-like regulatory domain-containing protein [Armatimonadota bacterium]
MSEPLAVMPAGYELQLCDDCGVPGRQPHIRAEGVHEYNPATVNADVKARTVAWGRREVRAVYEGLRPGLDYVLAVTYANEPYNNRVQSLWAGSVQVHGPHPLPKGGAERLLFRLPREALRDGKLELQFRLEGEVNVVVSVIELWAPAPGLRELHLEPMAALVGDLEGYVLDAAWDPVADASVFLKPLNTDQVLGKARTPVDGKFLFPRKAFASLQPRDLEVVAEHAGLRTRCAIAAADLTYSPLRYRSIPAREPGVKAFKISLDGDWWLDPDPQKTVCL